MTPEASLLTPEVRALVGTTNEAVSVTVTRAAVRRGCLAILGRDPGVAYQPGDEVPAYVLVALQPEGDELPMPDLMVDKLEVSNELEIARPLRLGEQLQVRGRVGAISERFGGRLGYSVLVRMDTEFIDVAGEVVARTTFTGLQYDARNAQPIPPRPGP